ncbi:DMT family transporter [Paenibacillus sp. GSMTC-2017]|uniref:DMT family transporter n=1 Tax=Paenibacillus sp. GSMTC-2017 TaxID=2794350 RepID=UPI0018DA1E4A|nr:DMT family transporter [Paenibacillus sp. GSMTC-2017]MBH5319474.1 DMT family transporter [Paenibacillus sp. GSMTC-2017]
MKGFIYAVLGGLFLTLQSVANAAIGESIGSWQAATLTQGTGFIAALMIVLVVRDKSWRELKQVKLVYKFGGAFAAVILFSNITAFHINGAALTVSALLIAQITVTLAMEKLGWFGTDKLQLRPSQWAGLGLMVVGILCLTF